jgi:hypothetical protein
MTKAKKTKTKKIDPAAKKKTTLSWNYDEEISMEEFIRRIAKLVCEPVRTLQELDGDMYLSDYRDLNTAFWRLTNAVRRLDGES